jgi:AcrR family transcriptional regulator
MTDTDDKRGRGRPRTLNKADVIDVAMQAYWEEGPTKVSLNAICGRAGVSKPSVYREFGNDDGLACAALEHYAQTVLARMLAITGSENSFSSKIRQIAHLSVEDPLHEQGCLFVKMRAVKDQMGPKTAALITQIEDMALDAFAKVLEEGRRSGHWQGTIPIELGARYLHAQVGLALDQRARGQDPKALLDLALSVLTHPQS